MGVFKHFLLSVSDKLILITLLMVGLIASRTLFESGYFIMHDDLQMMRQFTMEKCFTEGQIPCRWSPYMGYGFGFPLFNYYPPLPYLVGEIFRVLGFAFTETVKLTFALSIILSGFAMYLLTKEFFGKIGGIISASFYVWAPYRAVDVYVRGAMNEGWTFVFMPLILLFSYKILTKKSEKFSKDAIYLAVSYAFLFLTHNLIVIIFTPFFALWCLIWIFREKKYKKVLHLVLSGVWALGLAAFFTIPAFFEKNLVHFETLASDYFEFFAHFASIRQLLLSRFWGDGPSVFGIGDEMAFPVGHFHWIVSSIVLLFILFRIVKSKKADTLSLVVIFSALVGWFGAFMAHQRSSFIWFLIPDLKYVQFPWRFLTIAVLGMSIASGGLAAFFRKASKNNNFSVITSIRIFALALVLPLIIAMISWNWMFFKPVRMGPANDSQRFSGEAWRIQQAAGILDYLPLTAQEAPTESQKKLVEIMEGRGQLSGFEQGTYWGKFYAVIESDSAKVRLGILDFPHWRVFVKEGGVSEEISVFIPEEEKWGRIWVELPRGEHLVYAQLFNTKIRTVSNIISVISVFLLLYYIFWGNEAPASLRSGHLLPSLRREQNPSEAEKSSHSSTGLRPRFSAKGDKIFKEFKNNVE